MELNDSFANTLRKLRTEKELSQEELAFKANLHRTYISQLERGLKSPTLNTLYILAGVLDISLAEFINLIEKDVKK
jgi:transcriptional regulator with XRE-family HTH domain